MIKKLFNAILVFVVALIVLQVVVIILNALNVSIASQIAGVISQYVIALAILLGVGAFFTEVPENWKILK